MEATLTTFGDQMCPGFFVVFDQISHTKSHVKSFTFFLAVTTAVMPCVETCPTLRGGTLVQPGELDIQKDMSENTNIFAL
jgi:uncharacterized membrane protein YcgQ (UPF0703/DUF1980 family)